MAARAAQFVVHLLNGETSERPGLDQQWEARLAE